MKTKVFLSRPRDRTFKAYKEWIEGLSKSIGITNQNIPYKEYVLEWKEFWKEQKGATQ
jgi:hypothetical protein